MKRTTHLLSGLAAGAFLGSLAGNRDIALVLLGGLFGIVPDLDHLFSGLGRRVHRSPASHSLLAAAILAAGWAGAVLLEPALSGTSYLSFAPAGVSAGIVFLSVFLHALEDSLTFYGCKLLYPASKRVFKGPVRYDDAIANTLIVLLALAMLVAASLVDLHALPRG